MTVPTPSAELPSVSRPGAEIDKRITAAIEEANAEVRTFVSADLINGTRPASREAAELMVMRAQRDQLIGRVEDLAAELAPMQLVLRFFTALVHVTCGGMARFDDVALDETAAKLGVEFNRDDSGWLVEERLINTDPAGRKGR